MVAIESRDFYTLDILPLLLKAFVRGKRRDHCELHDDALFRETFKIPIEQKNVDMSNLGALELGPRCAAANPPKKRS